MGNRTQTLRQKKNIKEDEELLQITILPQTQLQKDMNWRSWIGAPVNLNYHQSKKQEKRRKSTVGSRLGHKYQRYQVASTTMKDWHPQLLLYWLTVRTFSIRISRVLRFRKILSGIKSVIGVIKLNKALCPQRSRGNFNSMFRGFLFM